MEVMGGNFHKWSQDKGTFLHSWMRKRTKISAHSEVIIKKEIKIKGAWSLKDIPCSPKTLFNGEEFLKEGNRRKSSLEEQYPIEKIWLISKSDGNSLIERGSGENLSESAHVAKCFSKKKTAVTEIGAKSNVGFIHVASV
jgi:hypothetical protein